MSDRTIETDSTLAIHDNRWHMLHDEWKAHITRIIDLTLSHSHHLLPAATRDATIALAIVCTNDTEIQQLNQRFRGKDTPTNVLSFPADQDDMQALQEAWIIGDVILSYDTILVEAAEQGKAPLDHATHMIVHGLLHLLGLDHLDETEAEAMEQQECAILAQLQIANPYELPEPSIPPQSVGT